MHNAFPKLLLLFLSLLFAGLLQAQLCTGSLGDPVVNITFGAGQNPGPNLNINSYQFQGADCPNDGVYSVRNATGGCFAASWHTLSSDHTGDPNGYFMLVNASFQAGDFFVQKVSGLCGNTTYEFAAWIVNVLKPIACNGAGIKPNLTFAIETTSGTKLATFNSGDIGGTNLPEWKQYGTFFTTPANVSDVVVRLTNNAPGGCGNDLALDDITFRPCGASIQAGIEGLAGNRLDLCANQSSTHRFVATFSGGYNNPEFQWQQSLDNGASWASIEGASSPVYEWQSGSAGFKKFRVLVAERGNINSTACRIASRPLEVDVHGIPALAASKEVTVCAGSEWRLEARTPAAQANGHTFTWNRLSGATEGETIEGTEKIVRLFKKTAALQDSGIYLLRTGNAFGCAATDTFRLNVHHKPQVDFSAEGPACAGTPLPLHSQASVENSTINAYGWQWGSGEVSGERNITPVFAAAATYPVSFWATAQTGCTSDTVTKNLLVHPNPVAAFSLPEVCLADAYAQFTSLASVEGGSPLQFRWSFGDAQNPNFIATDKDPKYRYPAVGQYSVKLEVATAAGCKGDSTQVFVVNGSRPKALFTLAEPTLYCSALPVVLRNASTVDFGQITRVEIFWKGVADPQAYTEDEDPQPGKEYGFDYAPFFSGAQARFTIRFVAYSGKSCFQETTQEITLHRSPEVVFNALDGMCADQAPFLLAQASEKTGIAGTGVYIGPGVDGSGQFRPQVAGAGNHLLAYRYVSVAGCADTAVQEVQVWALPQVSAGPDRTLVKGGTITLAATAPGSDLQLAWSPATGLSNPAVLNPAASPEADVLYRLSATNAHGCTAWDEVQVRVVPDLYIPNAFTPNGDGLNDLWQVPNLESLARAEVRVFNRYGQEVFFAQGNGKKWDGRFRGKDQPIGAYVYFVDLKNGKKIRGTLLLLR